MTAVAVHSSPSRPPSPQPRVNAPAAVVRVSEVAQSRFHCMEWTKQMVREFKGGWDYLGLVLPGLLVFVADLIWTILSMHLSYLGSCFVSSVSLRKQTAPAAPITPISIAVMDRSNERVPTTVSGMFSRANQAVADLWKSSPHLFT